MAPPPPGPPPVGAPTHPGAPATPPPVRPSGPDDFRTFVIPIPTIANTDASIA